MLASCSPSQATENDDIQRYSKDIYNNAKYYLQSGTDKNNMWFVVLERIRRYGSYSLAENEVRSSL